jgi:hypothetical protein
MKPMTTFFLAAATCAALTLTLVPASQAARRSDASAGAKLADAVLVRPVMMVLSLAGSALYLGTTPLTVPTGIADETAKVLYRKPWRFTNGRRLGDF